jgi:hypothetical protein
MSEENVKLTYLEDALKQAEALRDVATQLPLDSEGKALLLRFRLNHLCGFLSGGHSAGVTIKVIKQQQDKAEAKEAKDKD